ncbi:MAG: ArnT family glycosyltransferase [Chloroflexota bacterium]
MTRLTRSKLWSNDRLWEALAIAAILLAAAALRLVRLASLPPGMFTDEAVNGVNVQTILAGAPRLYYGEREPMFMYLAALTTLVLGPSPMAIRAAAALSGIVGVAAGGALARQLFGRVVGLLAAAGIASSLWLTTISRLGLRAITLPAVECLGLALLWRATRTGRRRDYALGGAVLGLSLYTYLSSRFLPFALVAFVVLALAVDPRWMRARLLGFAVAGVFAAIVCLPLGYYALHHPDMLLGRPDQVALPGGSGYLPALIANVGRTLGMLFFHGDANWRQNFRGAPVFDPLNSVVFVLGLIAAIRWFGRAVLLVLVLFVVMLVPSMLSIDSPHYLRTAGAAPVIYTLWALGLVWLARLIRGQSLKPDPHPNPLPGGEGVHSPSPSPVERRLPPPEKGVRGVDEQGGEATTSLAALVVAIVLVVAFARTGWTYFVDYANNPAVPDAFTANLAAAGRFLAVSPIWQHDRSNAYLTDLYHLNRASVAFFLYRELPPAGQANWLDDRSIGSFFAQDGAVPLPVAPSVYLVDGDGQMTLAALGPAVQRTAWIEDGPRVAGRAIWAGPASGNWFGQPKAASFGQSLELERVSVQPTMVGLRWKIRQVPDYQPSIFVHVQDDQGHTLATADQVIGYPIEDWRVGQELVTWHPIHLPAGTLPGQYRLTAGVYRKATGAREPALVGGKPAGDVVIGQLALTTPVAGPVAFDHPIGREIQPGLALEGYDLGATDVEAGTKLSLTLAWQATTRASTDFEVVITARTASGASVGEWRGLVGGPAYPTSRWRANQQIRQLVDLPIVATASGTAGLDLSVSPVGASSQPSVVSVGQITVKASTHRYTAPAPAHGLDVAFSGVGTLIGFDLPDRQYAAGETLPITLYWKSQGSSPVAYTVFVHLLDAQSHVVGQRDEPPVHGSRPTTGWVANEYLADEHDVSIDPKVAPGTYQIEVGLYDPSTGQRVATGTPDNRVIIGTVRVGAPAAAPR